MSEISKVIKKLMFDKQIRTNELSRLTNIPQPTLHRIVEGITESPNLSALNALAKFFSITTDQLVGKKPMHGLLSLNKIPILEWNELTYNLANGLKNFNGQMIYTEVATSINIFALNMNDSSMEPNFPQNTTLIFDPNKPFFDRNFVLAQLWGTDNIVIFRQLLIDNNQMILMPLNLGTSEFKIIVMDKNNDRILGVLIQARRDYI